MCEPTTIAAVATVASTAFGAYTQIQEGKFQNDVAKYNASVAENEAEQTRAVGVEEENKRRRATAELLSKQRAQIGASGVSLASGSALQLQEDTELLGEVDALRIRSNAGRQASSLESEADLTRLKGEFARSRSIGDAFGTVLGGTAGVLNTGVADKWLTSKSSALKNSKR